MRSACRSSGACRSECARLDLKVAAGNLPLEAVEELIVLVNIARNDVPQQPNGHLYRGRAHRGVLRAGARPRDGDPGRGLHRVPADRRPRRDPRPAAAVPEPGPPAHLQQVLRARRPAGRLRDRLDRSSARRSTPCASRSASTRSPRRPGQRRSATRTTSRAGSRDDRRAGLRRGVAARAGACDADSEANFSWIDLGDADEAEVVARPRGAQESLVRPGTPLGGPGHIRVTFGTHAENERFLAALSRAALTTAVDEGVPACYKVGSVKRTGTPTRGTMGLPAALESARYFYFWRFN